MKQHYIYMTFILAIMTMGSACQTGSGGSSQLTQTGWSAQCGDNFISIISSSETTKLQTSICAGANLTITLSEPPVCSASLAADCENIRQAIISSNAHPGGNNIPATLPNTTQCQLVCTTGI